MMPTNTTQAERAITRAKVSLILNQPWFGALVMKLVIENGESMGVDTMATDGTRLYYSPKFVAGLTAQELEGVIAHEVMHCALLHPYRREQRDMTQWNIAGDLCINDILVQSGFVLPKGVLLDKKYSGLHAEKVYAMLGEQKQQSGGMPKDANGKHGIGGVMDSPPANPKPDPNQKPNPGKGQGKGQGKGKPQPQPGTGSQPGGQPQPSSQPSSQPQPQPGTGNVPTRTESDWTIDVVQAEKVASAAGKMPGGLAKELRKSRECRTNYREVLKRFIDRTVAVDYSWSNPNRRMLGQGYVLPGIRKENCGELLIGVDTSGSVSGVMLDQFAADIADIVQTVRPSKVHVVYCDTRVHGADEYEPDGEPFTFRKDVARGGTYFNPVFQWACEHQVEPRACLYLTDLEPGDSPNDPGYPVLWCVPETCRVKDWAWGEVVEVTMDHTMDQTRA